MAMKLSDGGGGSFKNKGVKKPAASPSKPAWAAPKLQLAPKPVATIPAPAQRAPAPAPIRPQATIPGPIQRAPAPAPIYRAPAAAPVYRAPAAPVKQNWGSIPAPAQRAPQAFSGGGGGGGFAAAAAPAPFVAPAPPPDTRRRISGKKIGNGEIAELDSTFLDQDSALNAALKKYIADQDEESGRQTRDTDTAITGIDRNKTVGLTGLSEDFAARGLAQSGLFAKSNADAGMQYEKQKQNTRQMLADNQAKMKGQRGKFEAETTSTRQSARNEALARLARRADLVVED